MNRLREKYIKEIAPALKEEFGYSNVHQIPKVTKVVINAGIGRAVADSKHLEQAASTIATVAGQSPVATVATKSIAGFKLREGHKIGTMVTLRGERMYDFLDKVISIVLPRIRDFRGISPDAFDPHGNYSLGIRDVSIFPELPYDTTTQLSLQVNVVTTAKTKEEGQRLLTLMGFPFRRNG
jgi:large subunit ribosomal protein L5